jgi:DNA-directed RNA polymerase specialized sigma24 family protein
VAPALLGEVDRLPDARAWLFKIVTNLSIDYLRRHSTWREQVLVETKIDFGACVYDPL